MEFDLIYVQLAKIKQGYQWVILNLKSHSASNSRRAKQNSICTKCSHLNHVPSFMKRELYRARLSFQPLSLAPGS